MEEQKKIPNGRYDAKIVEVEKSKSKAGNSMVVVTSCIYKQGERRCFANIRTFFITQPESKACKWHKELLSDLVEVATGKSLEEGWPALNGSFYVGEVETVDGWPRIRPVEALTEEDFKANRQAEKPRTRLDDMAGLAPF